MIPTPCYLHQNWDITRNKQFRKLESLTLRANYREHQTSGAISSCASVPKFGKTVRLSESSGNLHTILIISNHAPS